MSYFRVNSMVPCLTYTITEKGTVSIPSEIRAKYGLRKGAKVEFIDTQEGIVIVPVVPMKALFGADKRRKKLVRDMVREIHQERRREASAD
jgi:AbrB family looped-hinge helix DNA binding protein